MRSKPTPGRTTPSTHPPSTRTAGETGRVKDLVLRTGSEAFRLIGSLTAAWRPLPDFLLIGTKRGGTTSFYYDLLKVPQIVPMFPSAKHLPKANETKGVHFFDSNYHRGLRWYRSYMPTRGARDRAARRLGMPVLVGEASPYYLFHPLAAQRAHEAMPDAKIVLLLRDPVQRTYSHWKERRRSNAEPLSFEDALAAEPERLKGEEEKLANDPRYYSYAHEQQSYFSQSLYAKSLRRWADLFGMSNILVITSEEYYANQPAMIAQTAEFLGLDVESVAADARMNAAIGEPLSPELESRLRREFAADRHELEAMVGRSLPWP
ncbi:sulfotransferase domain-containing protein [Microbacterium sp. KR10-403]|uniref:sulfotransferase domain-containing protein n=1 Tax=Microbacterium sp. KR10-403 TaxID=3158581 RepID=UPI0032E45A49